ncbi:hypothetical protein LEP1GSC050_4116 [Leptospira broomii serovar Hurstbridge str. 5399]|uniref:Uncharacterized protein n=1 Tax=Leptospira broomii serovar Hurstbridge str. 5399 TaxID=1049789 RepID=T0GHK3_9LEPT|nr:hypothetical protein LEP1GSC050_4116 [Leptospira broomii serovar Hurstbridge str. 5399]
MLKERRLNSVLFAIARLEWKPWEGSMVSSGLALEFQDVE